MLLNSDLLTTWYSLLLRLTVLCAERGRGSLAPKGAKRPPNLQLGLGSIYVIRYRMNQELETGHYAA